MISPPNSSRRRPILLVQSSLMVILALICIGCEDTATDVPPVAQEPEQPTTAPTLSVGRVPAPDGVPIAYTSRGSGETALVFVHGWACDQTYWEHQTTGPLKDSYRVVTVDMPGHGESGAERVKWSLKGYGEDLAAVVQHLELDRVILVGHSMGGAVILEAARLLGDRVVGLIGVETFHDADFQVSEEQWQPMIDAYRQDYATTCQTMVAAMFTAPSELATRIQEDMCSGPQDVGIALMERFGTYRGADVLQDLTMPVRAINAEHSLPTQIETNRKYSPTFDAIIQEGVGHFPMLEAPERFQALLVEMIDAVKAEHASS